tara:strand:- start:134 stop:547 length:414 start_codon:yes stop_codon:yes gene_type:complete
MDHYHHYIQLLNSIEQNEFEATTVRSQLEFSTKEIFVNALSKTLHMLDFDILFDIYVECIRRKNPPNLSISNPDHNFADSSLLTHYMFLLGENKKLNISAENIKQFIMNNTTREKISEDLLPILSSFTITEILNILN